MRLLLATMSHETNTFSPVPTGLARFCRDGTTLLKGDAAAAFYRDTRTCMGGYLEIARAAGAEVTIAVTASAPPPDAANWEATLFPAYGFEPKPPEGTAWSYGSSAAGRWFCLSAAKATEALRGVLVTVGKRYAAASYQVSAKCGDPATTDTGGDTLAATLWVSREGR